MSIYLCSKCLFCFERSGVIVSCPDCGNINIRFATDEEAAEFKRNQEEFNKNESDKQKNVI